MNYIGQLRLYSLVDLLLLLQATQVTPTAMVGAISLWLGFLVHLESEHKDRGRQAWTSGFWALLLLIGLGLYGRIEGLAFAGFSYLYSKKKVGKMGLVTPIIRGLQTLVLVGGLVGYQTALPWLAGSLITVRNWLGDWRDIEKDRAEGIVTWPVVWQLKPPIPQIHLLAVIATSTIWWHQTDLSAWWLVGALAVEIVTYNWTPR